MKTFISLIVLTTLVAQLPQLQARPQWKLNSELIALLQGLLETEVDMQEDVEIQRGDGIYSTDCSNDITKGGILKQLNQYFSSQFEVEIRCGHPTSSCTRLTDYKGASYERYVELCDKGHYVCRAGHTTRIRIGTCNDWELAGPHDIDIPVGSGSKTVGAQVFYSKSDDGKTLKCLAIENFSGPACPGY